MVTGWFGDFDGLWRRQQVELQHGYQVLLSCCTPALIQSCSNVLLYSALLLSCCTPALILSCSNVLQHGYQVLLSYCIPALLMQELLESRLRGSYQATWNVPFPNPVPHRLSWKPMHPCCCPWTTGLRGRWYRQSHP